MHTFFQDLRFARRTWMRQPWASAVVVLTLAAGIGANATFFSMFYGMVLRPFPFRDPERLVTLNEAQPEVGTSWMSVAAPNLRDWLAATDVLAAAAPYRGASFNFREADGDGGEPERLSGARVAAGLFPMLGLEPFLGRGITAAEDRPGGPPVALLGYRLWQRRFAADPAVVGRTVRLDGVLTEVIGVMPEGMAFPLYGEVWVPLAVDADAVSRGDRQLVVIGRLVPGVSVQQAQAALEAVAARLAQEYPETNAGWSVRVRRLHDAWLPPVTQLASFAQQGLVGLVLLIVAANVTNLLLAQATVRRREMALRAALGAGRARLVRQTLTECTLMALAGGALGTLLALWLEGWIERLTAIPIPYWLDFRLDGRVLLYTLVVSLVLGLAIGLLPALRASAGPLVERLQGGGRGAVGASGGRLRRGLVVGEFALAVVVLVAAVLMVGSFLHLQAAAPGFRTEGVLTARLSLSGDAFREPAARSAAAEELARRVAGLAEVEHAGVVSVLPISRAGYVEVDVEAEGRPAERGHDLQATYQAVTEGALDALGIALVAGRGFTTEETRDGATVAIVGRSLAERLWPGRDAVGRRLRTVGGEPGGWRTVVGVAAPVEPGEQIAGIDSWPRHQLYIPYGDLPSALPTLVVATRAAAEAVVPALRREAAVVAPGAPLFDVFSMREVLRRFYFAQHIWSRMFALLGVIALAIAGLGAYGVLAYTVSQRRREMGLRIAVGAGPAHLEWMVVRQGLATAGLGVVLGLAGAVPLARWMSSLLHGMSATDPLVFAGVVALLLAVAAVASYLPARRASAVEPIEALRVE